MSAHFGPCLSVSNSFPARILGALVFGISSISVIHAAEIRVKPDAGAKTQPITLALKDAKEGDVIILEPGLYREKLVIDKAVTLKGEPGAVLAGMTPYQEKWSPAGDDLPGVYVCPVADRPAGLLVQGKFVASLRFDRAQKEGEWHWKTLLKKGPPLGGFKEIKALWIYHPKERRVYARLPEGKAPSQMEIAIVLSEEPLIRFAGVKGAAVEGLEFAAGATAIAIGDASSEVTVKKCRIVSYEDTGIAIGGGASRCTVEDCSITRGALEEWAPSLEHNRANYEIWRIHKDVGNYDRVGINLVRAGEGNRIINNRIDRVFDGICVGDYKAESLDLPLPDPAHGRGTVIAGNTIENTRDSGIELGVGCVNVEVSGNTLRRTHGGFRFKAPRIGPVFIHHNRLISGSPFNFWFSMDASPAEGYIYHNTIVADRAALQFLLKGVKRDFTAPNWHFYNNLVVSPKGFLDPPARGLKLDITASHNVCTGGSSPWADAPEKDPGSRYGEKVDVDAEGVPAVGSAAIDAGLDLSTAFKGKPLPGTDKAPIKGKAPDAGAVEVN